MGSVYSLGGTDVTEMHEVVGLVTMRSTQVFLVNERLGEWDHPTATLKVQVPGLDSEALVGKKGE